MTGLQRHPLVALARYPFRLFSMLVFDPRQTLLNLRGMPAYACNLVLYSRRNLDPRFRIRWNDLYPVPRDRFEPAGVAAGDYFHQDLWAAARLYRAGVRKHVDVGSRIDGFIAHLLPFCEVQYVDIRPLVSTLTGLSFRQGSVTALPYPDDSVRSLSSLHVIEHVGLGRYGEELNPRGHLDAARELARVLAPGGELLVGVPVGRERLCFDAHRVLDPQTVVDAFQSLELAEFSLVDDHGSEVHTDASFNLARRCSYGCGLFAFRKPVSVRAELP